VRVAKETLRKWMAAAGIWLTRAKRLPKAHQPRHRRACFGELVQIDGSPHAWFEDRGPHCTLLVYIDDARGANDWGSFWRSRRGQVAQPSPHRLDLRVQVLSFVDDDLRTFGRSYRDTARPSGRGAKSYLTTVGRRRRRRLPARRLRVFHTPFHTHSACSTRAAANNNPAVAIIGIPMVWQSRLTGWRWLFAYSAIQSLQLRSLISVTSASNQGRSQLEEGTRSTARPRPAGPAGVAVPRARARGALTQGRCRPSSGPPRAPLRQSSRNSWSRPRSAPSSAQLLVKVMVPDSVWPIIVEPACGD
jgi:hypothetical protein